MWLEDDVNPAIATLPGRGQGGANLGRVMAIIINDAYSSCGATQLKAPINTAEIIERSADMFEAHVQANAHSDRRRGIEQVVSTRYAQREFAQTFPAIVHLETAQRVVFARIQLACCKLDVEIGTSPCPVGHHSALNLRHQPAQHRIIVTEHNRAIKGDAAHKIKKSSLYVPHVAIAVHVLAVNVGHYSQDGGELQERTIALIGFRHQVLRPA